MQDWNVYTVAKSEDVPDDTGIFHSQSTNGVKQTSIEGKYENQLVAENYGEGRR